MTIARRIRITGRVQGVWFRGWTEQQALKLGLAGWVRNRADGSVEILAEGDEDPVARLVEACRRGPSAAAVDRVDVEAIEPSGTQGFRQRSTQ